MIEATKRCEGQVVDRFPLRQYLGETEHSTVFLTQRDSGQRAAIKFVAAAGAEAAKQLSSWNRAAQLSHPHLLKLWECGRCQLGGRDQVYVVMEHAEENLSEILPERPLSAGEAKEMLAPLLDCLAYLHENGFVHGHLRPSNLMAVGDQLKLSSDGIRKAGEWDAAAPQASAYNAPEAGTTMLSASADMWSLGVTLVEALTQRKPVWATPAEEPALPSSLPEPFQEIARNCLRREPSARWTVPEVNTRLRATRPLSPETAAPVRREKRAWSSLLPVLLVIVAVLAIAGALTLFRRRAANPTSAARAQQRTEMPVNSPAAPNNTRASASSGEVVQQVPPKISPSAQHTIRGKIKLRVRVDVDGAGNVIHADLVSAGPSKYFARLVMEAAQQWKFVPSPQPGERRWMLHFDLTRKETVVYAQPLA